MASIFGGLIRAGEESLQDAARLELRAARREAVIQGRQKAINRISENVDAGAVLTDPQKASLARYQRQLAKSEEKKIAETKMLADVKKSISDRTAQATNPTGNEIKDTPEATPEKAKPALKPSDASIRDRLRTIGKELKAIGKTPIKIPKPSRKVVAAVALAGGVGAGVAYHNNVVGGLKGELARANEPNKKDYEAGKAQGLEEARLLNIAAEKAALANNPQSGQLSPEAQLAFDTGLNTIHQGLEQKGFQINTENAGLSTTLSEDGKTINVANTKEMGAYWKLVSAAYQNEVLKNGKLMSEEDKEKFITDFRGKLAGQNIHSSQDVEGLLKYGQQVVFNQPSETPTNGLGGRGLPGDAPTPAADSRWTYNLQPNPQPSAPAPGGIPG